MSGSPVRGWPAFGSVSPRYPPLAVIILALVLAIFALPSALNLPLPNPSQLTEYATVRGQASNSQSSGNFAGRGFVSTPNRQGA